MIRCAVVLLGCALVAGCASSPLAVRYYSLRAEAPPAGEPARAAARETVSVGPVTLPALVDRPQLVVRTGGTRVRILDDHRWAEPLKRAIPAVLAADLARELPAARVAVHGESAGRDPDWRVLVDVRRFDSAPGEAVELEALWTVRRVADGTALGGRFSAREGVAGEGYDALVAAHGRALARLAGEIAGALPAQR